MAEVDSLSISLTANTSDAESAIERLIGTLNRLKGAITGASNFQKITEGIASIAAAANRIDNSTGKKIADLANGLDGLSKVGKITGLGTAAKNIEAVGTAVNHLSEQNIDYSALNGMTDALTRMASIPGLGELGTALSGLRGMGYRIGRDMPASPEPIYDDLGPNEATPSGWWDIPREMDDPFDAIADNAGTAGEAIQELAQDAGETSGALHDIADGAGTAGEAVQELAQDAGNTSGALHDVADGARDAEGGVEELGGAAGNAGGGLAGFRERLAQIWGMSDGFRKGLAGLGQGLAGLGRGLVAIPKYFGGQLVGNVQNATKSVLGFYNQIKRVAMYRLIRTALRMITQGINQGMKNLYAFSQAASGSFAASMNQIAAASQYMGNSFAAMAGPLVDALAPAIDFIVDKFVAMFNTISQIIARLTGRTTYLAAKKVAATWSGAAKSAGKGASDSAKEAVDEIKRTIMGFDEINKLNDIADDASSGSSGGGGGAMFEELPIDSAISNFADQLKAAFLEGDWQELGTLLGTKVNELVDSIDWAGAGQTVGYYINGWFSTKYWTLETINFTNIGSKIAEFLNNAIAEIDFNILGRLMVQKMTIIGDLVIGFFSDFDFGQAASSYSDFVKGIYDQIADWFDKYDWGKLGTTLGTKLNDAVTKFDTDGIVESFGNALSNAINAGVEFVVNFLSTFDWNAFAQKLSAFVIGLIDKISDAVENVDWKNLGLAIANSIITLFGSLDYSGLAKSASEFLGSALGAAVGLITGLGKAIGEKIAEAFNGIGEFFNDQIEACGGDIVGGILRGVIVGLTNIGVWIVENIFQPFINGFKAAFGIASPAKTMEEPGKNIVLGIFQGIINALKNVGQWVKDNIFTPIWNAIKGAGETVINITVSLVKKVGEWAADAWEAVKMAGGTVVRIVEAGIKKAATWVEEAWEAAKMLGGSIFRTIETVVKKGATWIEEAWDAAKMLGATVLRTVEMAVKKASTWVDDAWIAAKMLGTTVFKTVETVVKKGATWIEEAWEGAKMLGATVIKTVETAMKKAASWVDGIVDFILGPESTEKKTNILMTIGDVAKAIINFLQDPVTVTKNIVLSITTKIGEQLSGFWDWLWGNNQETPSIAIPSVAGDVTLTPVPGPGWNTASDPTMWTLDQDVNATASITPKVDDNWQDEWDSLVGGEIDAQIKLNVIKGTVQEGVEKLIENAGGTIQTTVSTALTKASTWVEDAWTAITKNSNSIKVDTSLLKKGWTTISNFIGSSVSVATSLTKSGWSSISSFVGSSVSVATSLTKSGWSSISSFVGSSVSVATSLTKKGWSSISSFVGSSVSVAVKASLDRKSEQALRSAATKAMKGISVTVKAKSTSGGGAKMVTQQTGGVIANGWFHRFGNGGVVRDGLSNLIRNIPHYAEGTVNAHGTMFLAGEAGPEIMGHLNGRTEVLNQSQLAATMFSAVRNAMSGVKIAATMYDGGGDNSEADYETMYRAMYDAFTDAMAGSNERDREKVALMRQIAAKEFTAEVTAASVNRAQTRMNRRAGTTIVPVGT